ncbi:RluA family pseudouridine synthase [Bhargavaea ginsengi]|uniref:RluA family pseudouridine synthase n=1 Tax=Bhargavaea ginsengi TaxID=426757 RepID=UPI002559BF19|nr:RluA family pseudouridine synthase [Bhargavaea ginsengi]MCM3088169.1 RluA family pseudouridine synthase [Bhargavaea ginsengi]
MSSDRRYRLSFTVEADVVVLRDFLAECGISRRTLTAVKYKGGNLLVNGEEKTVRHILRAGDGVTIIFPPEKPAEGLFPEEGMLSVLYEDEALLILDKPAGQATIPSRDAPLGTLANSVAGKFMKDGTPATVHVVTRLDRETSGIVCIAKNRHIHHLMSEKMKTGGVLKRYEAIAGGEFREQHFFIDEPIGRKEGSIIERMVLPGGQRAVTEVRVMGIAGLPGNEVSRVSVILHTGRTHQIRVHLAHIGHPLEGDTLYGGSTKQIGRQALHCAGLSFSHPLTGEPIAISSPVPADMLAVAGFHR